MTPIIVAFIAHTVFALKTLGAEIEEPLGTEANDLALGMRLSRMIGCQASAEPGRTHRLVRSAKSGGAPLARPQLDCSTHCVSSVVHARAKLLSYHARFRKPRPA